MNNIIGRALAGLTMGDLDTTHTPGPWTVGRGYSSTHATPVRWKGENLAWACGTDSAHEFTKEQAQANARLIAAAPELLAALSNALGMLEEFESEWETGPGIIEDARAAIRKAEGRLA